MSEFEAKCSLVADAYSKHQRSIADLGDLFEVNDLAAPGAIVVTQGLGVLNQQGRRYVEEAWVSICEAFSVDPVAEYWALNDLPGWEGCFEE